jgi:hypothetical protein
MIVADKLGVVFRLALMWPIVVSASYAQQPLLQITSPANQSLAPEGQTLTIMVSADFKHFFIGNRFGVVAAAIQGSVDCEDYISHWIVLTSFRFQCL